MEELEKRTQMLQFNERIERESPRCCVYGQHRHNCSKCCAATLGIVTMILCVPVLVKIPFIVLFSLSLLTAYFKFTIIAVYVVLGIVLMFLFLKFYKQSGQNLCYFCCDIFCLQKLARADFR